MEKDLAVLSDGVIRYGRSEAKGGNPRPLAWGYVTLAAVPGYVGSFTRHILVKRLGGIAG